MHHLTLPGTRIGLATEGRVITVRHGKLATHTGETAHPQLHAGSIAAHLADQCMSRHRLVLAPRRGGHTGAPRHPEGAMTLNRTSTFKVYHFICILYKGFMRLCRSGTCASMRATNLPPWPERRGSQIGGL